MITLGGFRGAEGAAKLLFLDPLSTILGFFRARGGG